MLYTLVALIGIFIALMIALNSALGQYISVFEVSFLAHFIGLIILLVALRIRREKLAFFGLPYWYYFGGVFGALLTAIDAHAALAIGITLYITISTASQIISSSIVDAIGPGDLARVPFNPKRLYSIGLLLVGIAVMLYAQWQGV